MNAELVSLPDPQTCLLVLGQGGDRLKYTNNLETDAKIAQFEQAGSPWRFRWASKGDEHVYVAASKLVVRSCLMRTQCFIHFTSALRKARQQLNELEAELR